MWREENMRNRQRTMCRLLTAVAGLGLGAAASLAQTAGTSSVVDGEYTGKTVLEGGPGLGCSNGSAGGTMTIAAGKVGVKFINQQGEIGTTYSGTIDALGNVSATGGAASSIGPRTPEIRTLSGKVQGNTFTGNTRGRFCNYTVSMSKK